MEGKEGRDIKRKGVNKINNKKECHSKTDMRRKEMKNMIPHVCGCVLCGYYITNLRTRLSSEANL
jgi:ribosomal protein L32